MNAPLSRRTLLKGVGATVALPLLEAMAPRSVLAATAPAKAPVRMAFISIPNGMSMEHWTPATVGSNYAVPAVLKPLEPLRDRFNVLTGLAQLNANALGDGPGDHARSSAAWLTGVHPKKTAGSDIRNGISVDQIAAKGIGGQTRFPSLEIGCERGAVAGNCDSGYSCAYSSTISWRSETTPVPKEINPRAVFERLFAGDDPGETAENRAKRQQTKLSVLDFVLEEAGALQKELGQRDKLKLEEYLQSVREIEVRLHQLEKKEGSVFASRGTKPQGIPQDYREHIRLMGDMMILAFQADLTRVCTFMFANEGSNRAFVQIGVNEGHHDVSHHGLDGVKLEKKRQIDLFYAEQLAYILDRMAKIEENGGTLLDNSMIVYGGGISDGDRHNHDNLPVLFAGRGGGAIKTGRHIRYDQTVPMTNMYLSMLDRVGVNVEKLGDSTGRLQGLF